MKALPKRRATKMVDRASVKVVCVRALAHQRTTASFDARAELIRARPRDLFELHERIARNFQVAGTRRGLNKLNQSVG